ncbi:TonB C-terminal domain-containing protein [Vreelandella massiliensis]|uniref:TonB C-terminal domain-containing protein n=1 Tax=Vreelandella massiliensis TaxID=1816686 RepID=UPI001B3061CB|nr:TonB C-terminal domain-containing protein [Halomonas massiliensis]
MLQSERQMTDTGVAVPQAELGLEPEEKADFEKLLVEAQDNADRYYEQGVASELSFFSPESLETNKRNLSVGELTEDVSREIAFGEIGSAPIVYVQEEKSDESQSLSEQIDTLYKRVSRLLGSHQQGAIRPVAMEASMEMASWQLRAGVGEAPLSSTEMERQQIAFLSSGRLKELAITLGDRVHDVWQPPENRFVPDGALLSVVVGDDKRIESLAVEHSTGRTAYDQSVIEALHQAAPFYEINELQPWLQDTVETLLFSFGRPPASPEDFRRSQQVGEHVFPFEGTQDDNRTTVDYLNADYFEEMFDDIERELTVLNASRWNGQLENDAEILVEVSLPLGVVVDVQVQRGSGDLSFDRLVMQAVDNASPFRGIRHLPEFEQQNFDQFIIHAHPDGLR